MIFLDKTIQRDLFYFRAVKIVLCVRVNSGDRQAPGYIKEWRSNGIKWVFRKYKYFVFFFFLKMKNETSGTTNIGTQLHIPVVLTP
jgi:hypothetical protein